MTFIFSLSCLMRISQRKIREKDQNHHFYWEINEVCPKTEAETEDVDVFYSPCSTEIFPEINWTISRLMRYISLNFRRFKVMNSHLTQLIRDRKAGVISSRIDLIHLMVEASDDNLLPGIEICMY